MAVKNTDLMTGYEKRIFSGWNKSASDLLKDNKMVATAVKDILGVEVERQLETGEAVNVPIVVDLVASLLAYWKDHPEKIDLKVLSTVLGETKQEVVVNSETATDVFGGIVAGTKLKTDDSSS